MDRNRGAGVQLPVARAEAQDLAVLHIAPRKRGTPFRGVVARIGCQVLTQAFATTTDMLIPPSGISQAVRSLPRPAPIDLRICCGASRMPHKFGNDGGSRTDPRIGGVGLQIIRDWVLRFSPRTGRAGRWEVTGAADHRRKPAAGVVIWRVALEITTGFAKISARPRKHFPAELAKIRARLPKGVEIELWWQDEARIGQKNKLTRRWARRGTRPRAPRDQRTEWAYIFGAICPAKEGGLVMPVRHRRHGGALGSGRPCGADHDVPDAGHARLTGLQFARQLRQTSSRCAAKGTTSSIMSLGMRKYGF